MNEVLTGVLLKGLEAVQKVNKGMGKLNMDKITISVEGETMTINSINFNHQVQMTIPVDHGHNFSTGIIGLEKMIKALKKFDTLTTFELDGERIIVSDNKKKVQLIISDTDGKNDLIKDNPFIVSGVKLNEAYTKVKKSICKEDSRPILTGVHFKNNYMETVDGYRISQVKITEPHFENDFVIDPKSLEIILPVAKKDKLDVTIATTDKEFTLTTGDTSYSLSITGRLFEGEFLKTEQVFSNDSEYSLSFSENKELLSELEFIKDMAGVTETGKPQPIRCLLNNDKMIVCDTSENTSTTVQFDKLDGKIKDVFKIAFNPNYMLDAIKNISGAFTMQFISHLTPCIISNEQEKYLVLPVRLNN